MSADTAPQKADPLIGRIICGCKVIRLIAQGGMGNLYEARQVSLDRIVALKVLAPALVSNQQFLKRFQREARSLANLIHTNIVAVHDFGSEGNVYGIVMEHVPGESVADMLTRVDIIPISTAMDICRQIADGLAFAHRHQIIHCDMKPENILVTPDGVAKVVDFGLAKSLGGDAMKVTQDGTILGTPRYMSPEQCAGAKLDHRTDIYSLGATVYRMVAGRDIFEGDNPFAIMLKHKSEEPPDPRDFNPEIPIPLANIILRMLEKDRDKRFQAAEDVSAALRHHGTRLLQQQEAPHPRRDLVFVRDLLETRLSPPTDVRRCLALQDELRNVGVEESLASLMVKRGFLDKDHLAEIQERRRISDAELQGERFQQLALESGLATTEQMAKCAQGHRRRIAAGKDVSFTTAVIELGVLNRQQVVEVLREQTRRAQASEDKEFLELVRAAKTIPQDEIDKCIAEQRRLAEQDSPRLLRQIAVELGLIPSEVVRDLLYKKVREEIDEHLRHVESTHEFVSTAVAFDESALKIRDTEPCPACGAEIRVGTHTCLQCAANIEQARREAARTGVFAAQSGQPAQPSAEPAAGTPPAQADEEPATKVVEKPANQTGHWQIRLASGEPSKLLPFARLLKLARERRLAPKTVLRGPLTRGVWRQARHTPRLCRLFGVCHFCETSIPAKAPRCPACGALLDRPADD